MCRKLGKNNRNYIGTAGLDRLKYMKKMDNYYSRTN